MYCARRVTHNKLTFGHYVAFVVLLLLVAGIICLLPRAIDIELDMAEAKARQHQAQASN
jgi:hypothetical protein